MFKISPFVHNQPTERKKKPKEMCKLGSCNNSNKHQIRSNLIPERNHLRISCVWKRNENNNNNRAASTKTSDIVYPEELVKLRYKNALVYSIKI